MLGFVGHVVSVVVIQLCCHSLKAATDKMYLNGHGCFPIKLYWHKGSRLDFACRFELAEPVLENNRYSIYVRLILPEEAGLNDREIEEHNMFNKRGQ